MSNINRPLVSLRRVAQAWKTRSTSISQVTGCHVRTILGSEAGVLDATVDEDLDAEDDAPVDADLVSRRPPARLGSIVRVEDLDLRALSKLPPVTVDGYDVVTAVYRGSLEISDDAGHCQTLKDRQTHFLTAGDNHPVQMQLTAGIEGVWAVRMWLRLPAESRARQLPPKVSRSVGYHTPHFGIGMNGEQFRANFVIHPREGLGPDRPCRVPTENPFKWTEVRLQPHQQLKFFVPPGLSTLLYCVGPGEINVGDTKLLQFGAAILPATRETCPDDVAAARNFLPKRSPGAPPDDAMIMWSGDDTVSVLMVSVPAIQVTAEMAKQHQIRVDRYRRQQRNLREPRPDNAPARGVPADGEFSEDFIIGANSKQ